MCLQKLKEGVKSMSEIKRLKLQLNRLEKESMQTFRITKIQQLKVFKSMAGLNCRLDPAGKIFSELEDLFKEIM